jgi:hypothetical protein
LGAIASVVMVWCVGSKASAAGTLLAKAAVQYTDSGAPKGMDCDDCVQFIPGKTPKDLGTCKVVEGAINPHGHCLAFSPQAKS